MCVNVFYVKWFARAGELGRAFSQFARFEEAMAARQGQYTTAGSTAVQRGADLQRLGYGALRQHSLSKQVGMGLNCTHHTTLASNLAQGHCRWLVCVVGC